MPLPLADKGRRLHQPEDHIHFVKGSLCHRHHIFTQFIFRLVDPRCIKKHDLTSLVVKNGLDPVSGSLGFVAGYGDLLANDPVHQC